MTDRAEQAFRDAFAEHANEAPLPLRSAPPPRRRNPWLIAVAAAALVVAVAVPVGGILLDREPPQVPIANPAPAPLTALPEPSNGFTWASAHGVAAEIPEGWLPSSLRESGCAPVADAPVRGFADPEPVDCPATGRSDVVLEFLLGREQPVDNGPAKTRTVGGVTVWVGMPDDPNPAQEALAARILKSAVAVTVDENACPSEIPFTDASTRPEPWDLTSTSPTGSMSYCSYASSAAGVTLERSWEFKVDDAAALAIALQKAPVLASPDPACTTDRPGVLRVTQDGGSHDIFVRGACGIDDGRSIREYTPALCEAIYGSMMGLEANGGNAGGCAPVPPGSAPPRASDGSVIVKDLGEPKPGWKWVTGEGVAVQVPDTWVESNWPWEGPCVGTMPETPYVATPVGTVPDVDCPLKDVPESERPHVMHLEFGRSVNQFSGVGAEVGGTWILISFGDPEHAVDNENDLANEIIETAVVYQP